MGAVSLRRCPGPPFSAQVGCGVTIGKGNRCEVYDGREVPPADVESEAGLVSSLAVDNTYQEHCLSPLWKKVCFASGEISHRCWQLDDCPIIP